MSHRLAKKKGSWGGGAGACPSWQWAKTGYILNKSPVHCIGLTLGDEPHTHKAKVANELYSVLFVVLNFVKLLILSSPHQHWFILMRCPPQVHKLAKMASPFLYNLTSPPLLLSLAVQVWFQSEFRSVTVKWLRVVEVHPSVYLSITYHCLSLAAWWGARAYRSWHQARGTLDKSRFITGLT